MLDHSGLAGFWHEATAFSNNVRFQRPVAFVLILIVVGLALLTLLARRRQQIRLQKLGYWPTLQTLRTRPVRRPWLTPVLAAVAWLSLIVALAGPTWGRGEADGILVGRDVTLVLDLSRSMLAADAAQGTRFDTARQACLELLDRFRQRGGHRVALVVFAARPIVWVPLTADLDHVQQKLQELDIQHPPVAVRPVEGSKSGTRIGAALRLALTLHDQKLAESQDILLLSDGDDPLNDEEWSTAIGPCRQARIPVHTVGLGDADPMRAVPIILDGLFLESVDANGVPQPIRTQLQEAVLKRLAEGTRGQYLAAQRESPRLVEFFQQVIQPKGERLLEDEALPQRQPRAAAFLLVVAACWLAILWRSW